MASKISVRYAKALYELAQEKNCVDHILADLESIGTSIKEDELLRNFLMNPVVTVSQKKGVFVEGLKSKVHEITASFLNLLVQNKREMHLDFIILNFIDRYKKAHNIQTLHVVTAEKLSEDLQNKLTNKAIPEGKGKVDLNMKVDPDIIGGYVVRINDMLFDASIQNQLKKFELSLTKSI